MARVGFDIDGVLFDFTGRFHRFAEAMTGESLLTPETWEFWREWDWTREQFDELHVQFVSDGEYTVGEPMDGVQPMRELVEAGHEIVLVTARHVEGWDWAVGRQTRDWLTAYSIPFDGLHFTSDKAKIDVDYFIDDQYENYLAMDGAGVVSFLRRQPWNEDRLAMNGPAVYSIREYVNIVLGAEARKQNRYTAGGYVPGPEDRDRRERSRLLETSGEERKKYPMATGLLDYFPDALAEVAKLSYQGNQKHNPGEPMHHARGKSMDHADCIMRHLSGRGGFDGDTRESAALAWRSLALLQEELEREFNLPLPRGARNE